MFLWELSSFGSGCGEGGGEGEVGLTRRWPSCFLIILSTRKAPQVPHARAWPKATRKVLLRGKAAKEMPVTPRNTAIGAAAAAACPGFGALYTNWMIKKHQAMQFSSLKAD